MMLLGDVVDCSDGDCDVVTNGHESVAYASVDDNVYNDNTADDSW